MEVDIAFGLLRGDKLKDYMSVLPGQLVGTSKERASEGKTKADLRENEKDFLLFFSPVLPFTFSFLRSPAFSPPTEFWNKLESHDECENN